MFNVLSERCLVVTFTKIIMYLIYHFFTSVIFAMINAIIVIYMCQRFFRVRKEHYQIMAEAERFISIISESRASLDYISSKISEEMNEMKEDIARELSITDHLTKLSSKIGLLLQRYSDLEQELIEEVRKKHNMKSVQIETPVDINEEVKNILMAIRKKQPQQLDRPQTPRKLLISTTTSAGIKDSQLQNPIASPKLFTLQSCDFIDFSNVVTYKKQEKPRTPVHPEVQLLNDSRPAADTKPIGFRPSWKCEA